MKSILEERDRQTPAEGRFFMGTAQAQDMRGNTGPGCFTPPSPGETEEEKLKRISENINGRIRETGTVKEGVKVRVMRKDMRAGITDIMPEFDEMFKKVRAERSSRNPYPENSGAWRIFEEALTIPPGSTGLPPERARNILENGAFTYTMLKNPCTYDSGDAPFSIMRRSTDALTATCITSVSIIDMNMVDRIAIEKWLDESLEYYNITPEEPDERMKDLWLAYAVCSEAGERRPDKTIGEIPGREHEGCPEEGDDSAEEGFSLDGCISFVLKSNMEKTAEKLSALRKMGEEGKAGRIEIIKRAFPDMVYGAKCVREHFSRMSEEDISEMLQTVSHPACEAMMSAHGMSRMAIGNYLIAVCDYLETTGTEDIDVILRKAAYLYIRTQVDIRDDITEETKEWVRELDQNIHNSMKKVKYVVWSENVRVFYQHLLMTFTGSGTNSILENAGISFMRDFLMSDELRRDRLAWYIESHPKRERERVKKALMDSVKDAVSIIRSRMENPGRRYRTTDVEAWRECFLYFASFLVFCNEDLPEKMYRESEEASKKAEKAEAEAEKAMALAEEKTASVRSLESEIERLERKLDEKAERGGKDEKERNRRLSELNRSLLEAQERIAELEDERRRNRREIDALTDAFSQFESETGGKEETPGDESDETRKTAERLNREYRGVFIGGHPSFISRILKLYPSWKSYSYGDKAKMDPMVFRNADVVVVFAEHMSHSTLFESKKYMKTSDAVPVYSFTTNLDALTEKLSQALESGDAGSME